jgi:hypothetical protein
MRRVLSHEGPASRSQESQASCLANLSGHASEGGTACSQAVPRNRGSPFERGIAVPAGLENASLWTRTVHAAERPQAISLATESPKKFARVGGGLPRGDGVATMGAPPPQGLGG